MPKARKKKNSSFQTTITKSVFLYGRPNKEKLAVLRQMLQNAIWIVYEKRHIAYEEKKQHLHESRRDSVTSYMMLQDLICD